VRAVSEYR